MHQPTGQGFGEQYKVMAVHVIIINYSFKQFSFQRPLCQTPIATGEAAQGQDSGPETNSEPSLR